MWNPEDEGPDDGWRLCDECGRGFTSDEGETCGFHEGALLCLCETCFAKASLKETRP